MPQQLNLLTLGNQRWLEGRHSFVPPSHVMSTRGYEVAEIANDTEPREFIERNHYLRRYCAARRRFGVYRHGRLEGVVVYAQPSHNRAGVSLYGGTHLQTLELKRLCLLEGAPFNLCSWLIKRTFEVIRRSLAAEPEPGIPWRRHEQSGHFFAVHEGRLWHAAPYKPSDRFDALELLPDADDRPDESTAATVPTRKGKFITKSAHGRVVKVQKEYLHLEGFSNRTLRKIHRMLTNETRFRGIVTYADPMMRTRTDGTVVIGGHVGSVYSSLSAVYVGRTRKRTIKLLPDASTLNERLISKIRKRESGWQSGVTLLQSYGADPPAEGADLTPWLETWLPLLTREYPHPGAFKFVFPMLHEVRRQLPESLAYPKKPHNIYVPAEPLRKAA